MENKRIGLKDYLVIGSLIFGMLFGAGNLVFPVHLGQLAGNHWASAAGGFILSGVLLPLLALVALSITRARGLFELALPVGNWLALAFLVLVHATIGPLCATPRTATVPYAIGVAPYLPANLQQVGLALYTGAFFLLAYFFALKEGKVTEIIGKVLNPAFLVMLLVIFLMAFIWPMGSLRQPAPTTAYRVSSFANGFLQGYNTMDALAMLIFGVTIIAAVQQLAPAKRQVPLATAIGGIVGIAGVGILYLGLIYLGTTSRHHFAIASNGGTTLNQVAHYYLGSFGNALLLTLATITCLTTAMGLLIAFSQDFHQRFPQISYKNFLRVNCLVSFLIANLGLDKIVAWSTPILMFLYPLAIVLILLGILSPFFNNHAGVYRWALGLTVIPAVFDMVNALPAVLRNSKFNQSLIGWASHHLPLFQAGFAWIPFALAGLIIGLLVWYGQRYYTSK
ncbi:branched-chain amino acid transport system II carrier protein [Limosilactobacillus sp.]|uniref:branched-chain amino acid transport system II carrier protein n=1 Tax=Limosilactobacillus sp. TaxID=2773925 RepID=UPI003F080449